MSQLSTHGNGAVYGQGDDIFKNLKTFSVASDNVAACLLHKNDQQGIRLVDVLQESQLSPSRRLKLNDGKSEALSVGLSNDRLFIADTEGKLYSVGRNELNTGERSLNLAPERDYQPAGEKFGAGKQVTGFMHGDDGALHILVTDHADQTHAHLLDEQSKGLKSGWNLTDALVLDNKRGLASGADPTPANTFDLGPSGRVGITDKHIQQWDTTTQGWKAHRHQRCRAIAARRRQQCLYAQGWEDRQARCQSPLHLGGRRYRPHPDPNVTFDQSERRRRTSGTGKSHRHHLHHAQR